MWCGMGGRDGVLGMRAVVVWCGGVGVVIIEWWVVSNK